MIAAVALLVLTSGQIDCLNSAYNAGETYGLAKTFRAIVLVESSGCVNELGDDGRSVGPAQIQVYTARKVCGCTPDEKRLREDQSYNLRLGGRFLAECFNRFWPDKRRSLYCYNVGIPAASKATANQVLKSRYVSRVLRAEKMLSEIKESHE